MLKDLFPLGVPEWSCSESSPISLHFPDPFGNVFSAKNMFDYFILIPSKRETRCSDTWSFRLKALFSKFGDNVVPVTFLGTRELSLLGMKELDCKLQCEEPSLVPVEAF